MMEETPEFEKQVPTEVAAGDLEEITLDVIDPMNLPEASVQMIAEGEPEGILAEVAPHEEAAADEKRSMELAQIIRMIPGKMAFKIGEVAEIAGVKTYVLRYWETEFDVLNPQKSAFNQRMYSRRDVETVLLIKKLLYDEKFSIAGAKKKIRELRKELKAEKQVLQIDSRMELLVKSYSELVDDVLEVKKLFN